MTIGLSHGGTTVYTAGTPSRDLLIGTIQGVVRLRQDDGDRWRESGRALEGEHVHALVREPASDRWFAGTYRSGVFVSADDGRTWEPRNAGLTESSVFSLATAPRADGRVRIFAGTEPAHLFFSDDLGEHWTELPGLLEAPSHPAWRFAGSPFAAHLKHINVAPGDPETIYASVEVGGLHRSRDGGQTFEELPVPHPDVHRTVIDPRDARRVYVTGGAGITLSRDGGDSWETLLSRDTPLGRYPDMLVHVPSAPDRMIVCVSQHGPRSWVEERRVPGGIVARTMDAGRSWIPCMRGLPSDRFHGSIEALCLEESPGRLALFTADTDGIVAWSNNGGDDWEIVAETSPVSKSVHVEMARGGGPTPIAFPEGQVYIDGVKVAG